MTFDKSVLPEIKALSDAVLEGIFNGSAFQKASKQVQVTGDTLIVPIMGSARARWVEEGERKPVVDAPVTYMEIKAKKMARLTLWTEELARDRAKLVEAIKKEMSQTLSLTYDETVAGILAAPAGFDSFTGLDPIVVSDYQTWNTAVSSRKGRRATAIVLNIALLDRLRGVVKPSGDPALNFTGDDVSGTINGKQYYVFQTEDESPIGYVGAFDRALWGVVEGSVQITPLTEVAETEDGKVIPLKQYNMVGILVEASFAHRIVDKDEFGSLTAGPDAVVAS
jgi:HK97 family phage major capsid protein